MATKPEDDIIVTSMGLTLEQDNAEMPFRPAVHHAEVRLSSVAFEKIMRQVFGDELRLPDATINLINCGLIDGGAGMVMHVRASVINQRATVEVELTPAGTGDLRVTITHMRVGMFGAGWLLTFFLGRVNQTPGLRQSGPKSIDINLATLLQSRNVPLDLRAAVTAVRVTSQELVLTLA